MGHCVHSHLGGQGSHLQCHCTKASDPRFHLHSKGFKGMVTGGARWLEAQEACPVSPVGLHSWKANLHGTSGTIQHWAFVAERLYPLSVIQNRIPAVHSCSPQPWSRNVNMEESIQPRGAAGSNESSLQHTLTMVQARLTCPEFKFLAWRPDFPELQQAWGWGPGYLLGTCNPGAGPDPGTSCCFMGTLFQCHMAKPSMDRTNVTLSLLPEFGLSEGEARISVMVTCAGCVNLTSSQLEDKSLSHIPADLQLDLGANSSQAILSPIPSSEELDMFLINNSSKPISWQLVLIPYFLGKVLPIDTVNADEFIHSGWAYLPTRFLINWANSRIVCSSGFP